MFNRVCYSAGIGAAKVVFPYVFLPGHVRDVGEKWRGGHKSEAMFKGICMGAGATIGVAISVVFSPQLYKAFWSAANTVNNFNEDYNTEAETPIGVKIEAGAYTGLVDTWTTSFGTEAGAEVADALIASAHTMSSCASTLFSRCLSRSVPQSAQNNNEVQNQPSASIV